MENNAYAPPEPTLQQSAQPVSNKKRLLLIIPIALVLLGAFVYEGIVPGLYGKSYLRNVQAASQDLQTSLKKVADSTTRPIFTVTGTSNQSDKNDIVILKDSVQDAEAKLASFNAASEHLNKIPASGYFGNYRKARDKQKQARSVSAEVKKRLDTYKEFVIYLDNSNKAAAKAVKEVEVLNSIATMTDRSEISIGLRDAADALRAALDAADYPVPKGFEGAHQKSIALMSTLARQCDDLADAVDRGDQEQINTIYLEIQATGAKTRAAELDFHALIGQDSTLIRGTKELPTLVDDLARD